MKPPARYRLQKLAAVVVGACTHGLAVLRPLSASGVPVLVLDTDASLPGSATGLAAFERVGDINGAGLLDALIELRLRIDCQAWRCSSS